MIKVRDLSFRFQGSDRYALRGVNLDIAPGEFVVITGPSGCGKSTLALALGGYLFRQHAGEATGTVLVDGLDTRTAEIYDVAEVVGLVQQNPEAQFCTLTVADEVAFGLENRCLPGEEIVRRMNWALSIVGAQHLRDRSLATLSGGEKQKVAIAAMMAAKPQVLIFDEPTSNLDPPATAEVFKVIEHIRRKADITVIVIEHKTGYLRPFNPRFLLMEEGRIIGEGAPSVPPSPSDTHQGDPGDSGKLGETVVSVRGLTFAYGDAPVLHDVTLDLKAGQFVAVMGDNGSGKTTLLRCLLGLLHPPAGQVTVLGRDPNHTPVSELARQAGFVFQNPDHQLFADSVWAEATFALRNFDLLDTASEVRATALLDQCGLLPYRDVHPYRLSYGERRRLNLVSILSHNPRLVLLDEVLIGQDPGNAAFIMNLLKAQTRRGSTVLSVTHDPETTRRYADRVIFLNSGHVIVDAPTRSAFAQLTEMGYDDYLPEPTSPRSGDLRRTVIPDLPTC